MARLVEDGDDFFLRYEPPVELGRRAIRESFLITVPLSADVVATIERNSRPHEHVLSVFTPDENGVIAAYAPLGYARISSERFMRIEVGAARLDAPAHVVVRVRPEEDLERVRACGGPPIFREQLERTAVRQYVVEADGHVASRGLMVLGRHGAALVTGMHTANAHRRRGMGRSILLRMIADALELRVEHLMLLATPVGEELYRSLGFESVCAVVGLARDESVSTSAVALRPEDRLRVRHARRLVHELRRQEDGSESLVLFHSDKEIAFDEPHLVPFGRGLLAHEAFIADSTRAWSNGAPHAWELVKDMLETLIAEGIVEREGEAASAPGELAITRTSTGAPGVEPIEHPDPTLCWSRAHDRCAELGRRMTGLAFEQDQLESFIPIFRVAHPALDTEGRQVGEANVRPELLQPIRTEWRLCKYPGSRFEAGTMNMSALRSLQKHWAATHAWSIVVRDEFAQRARREGDPFTLGELFVFSNLVLALPAYLLMRPEAPVPGGAIDAALASLFRVVDGLRFSTDWMLFGATEWAAERDAGERLDAAQFLHYVEKTNLFQSQGAVCSGAPRMIADYVDLMLNGRGDRPPADELAAQRERLLSMLGDLDAAFEYGAEGLLLHCHTRWFDLHEFEPVRALADHLRLEPARAPSVLAALDAWVVEIGRRMHLDSAPRARRALLDVAALVHARVSGAPGLPPLGGTIVAGGVVQHARDLRARATRALPEPVLDGLAQALSAVLAMERVHVPLVVDVQARINRRLRREPRHPLVFGRRELEAAARRPLASSVLARELGIVLEDELRASHLAVEARASA